MSTPPPAAPAQLILTITPDGHILVSVRAADGTLSPPQRLSVDLDYRLAAFVANMQTFARQHLASVESPAMRHAARPDGEPSIADAADGE